MSVLSVKPKFLYPRSRQFPFDEVAEKIVKALEERNFEVPGIKVKFDTYGSGEAKYKMVYEIIGDYFKLNFCRVQGRLGKRYNDTAALHEIIIPKQSIEVFEDESGPTYCLYVGNDWNSDKEWFMNAIKVNSKLRGEPRRYLKYKGNTYKYRATELVSYDDLGREYSPLDEPQSFNLDEKFNEFTFWLEENVLSYILSFPEKDIKDVEGTELIPYEGSWDVVYSLCDEMDAMRILKGKENPQNLELEDRHAYFGSGHRLVPLSSNYSNKVPEIATDGFIWCDVNQNINKKSEKADISYWIALAMGSSFNKEYIVAVKLKYANGVYVADNFKYDEAREKIFETIAPRTRLTDEELSEVEVVRGVTIIPISEYKGDYKDPMVLINRELDFDEIEWIEKIEK